MFLVESGQVIIVKEVEDAQPVILAYRGPGEMIGEIGLIMDEGTRSASVMAADTTRLRVIDQGKFWQGMRGEPDFLRLVLQNLVGQIFGADQSRIRAASTESELVDRFSSLSDEHQRLAELLQLRKETIDFIVHDLRNPLNLIKMGVQILEMEDVDQAERARFSEMIHGGIARMLAMVDAMLDVEKLEAGEAELNREETDLAALVHDVIKRLQGLAGASNVKLEARLDPFLPRLNIDALRIDRVLTNLIDNALKFTPRDGAVTIMVTDYQSHVRVAINDTGTGIPEDQRERVFARFAQTEEGRKAKGFGLGLAFCKTAVVAHGGEIWVEGGLNGVGTQFVFTLPTAPKG
jgi:signal transduction histidine kinase